MKSRKQKKLGPHPSDLHWDLRDVGLTCMEIGHLNHLGQKKRCAECLGGLAPKSRLQTQLCFLESMLKIEEFRLPKKKINILRLKKC